MFNAYRMTTTLPLRGDDMNRSHAEPGAMSHQFYLCLRTRAVRIADAPGPLEWAHRMGSALSD